MHRKVFILIILLLLAVSALFSNAKDSREPGRNLRIKKYDLDISFDFSGQTLCARCTMTIYNSGTEKLSFLPISLYPGLRTARITCEDSPKDLLFSQQVRPYTDFSKLTVNYIRVALNRPLWPSSSVTVTMDYRGRLDGYVHTGMRYIKDSISSKYTIIRPDCRAYPAIDTLSFKGNRSRGLPSFDYRARVTVPRHLTVANGGRLQNKTANPDGTSTYTYINYCPAWRMDLAIANYCILKDSTRRLQVFCFPENRAGGRRVLAAARKAVLLLGDWFGKPASMPCFSIIQVPDGYGSQADVTAVLQTSDVFLSEKHSTQLYHECSHLWNPPHLDPVPSRVESEGLAMFLQYLMQQKIEGRDNALEQGFLRCRKRYLQTLTRQPAAGDIPLAQLGNRMQTGLAYTKGMTFFTILYRLMGEKNFIQGYRNFVKKYFSSGATLEQFLSVMQKASPVDLQKFYQHWIHSGTAATRQLRLNESSTDLAKIYSAET